MKCKFTFEHFLNHQKEFEDERKVDIGEIFIYELSKSPQDEEMIDNDNEDIGSFYKIIFKKLFSLFPYL